jgi:ribosomal protein L37AE/L43A
MQEALNKELYTYLSEILNLLSEEKSSSINTIDSLVTSAGINVTSMKQCPNCHQQNIENQKQTCPKCRTCLLKLAEVQKGKIVEIENKSGVLIV